MRHKPLGIFRCATVLSAAIALLAAGCSGSSGDDAQSKADAAALQGTWEVISAESNGEPPPPGMLDGATFVFSGNQLTLMAKTGTFSLDATHTPRKIVFVRGKLTQAGIYELTATQLKFSVGPADDPATEFATKPRTDHTSFVLRRKK